MTLIAECPTADVGTPSLAEVWQQSLPTAGEITRARRRLHLKGLFIAGLIATSYWALVIANFGLLFRIGAAAALTISLVATGTSVMHDANHGSFSRRSWVNHTLAYTMDFLGGSSWLWRFKHNHLHHGNPNVAGMDTDIAQAPFARLAPSQPWRAWHRGQHIYMWFLYGFMNLKNLLLGDLTSMRQGGMDGQAFRVKPTFGDKARLITGKLVHVSWAIVLPLMFNPWKNVLLFYVCVSWGVGFVLAVVFQMAHCVDNAEFLPIDTPRRAEHFVDFQLRTTVDIGSSAPIVGPAFRWLVGGLDNQAEHHLAPRLPHTIYPMVARRFRAGCVAAGLTPTRRHTSVWAALCSHARWLKTMGLQPTTLTA